MYIHIKIDDVSCANLGADPPQPNYDRFRSSGGGNCTSEAAMVSRSLFRRVGSIGNTTVVMPMPYLLGMVGGRHVGECIADAPSSSRRGLCLSFCPLRKGGRVRRNSV